MVLFAEIPRGRCHDCTTNELDGRARAERRPYIFFAHEIQPPNLRAGRSRLLGHWLGQLGRRAGERWCVERFRRLSRSRGARSSRA